MMFLGVYYTSLDFDGVGAEGYTLTFIESKEQQNSDINSFMEIVSHYEHLTDITPEQMHELIERIEVHAPDKSSGHRQQKVDIYFRFKVACSSVTLDRRNYQKKKKAA